MIDSKVLKLSDGSEIEIKITMRTLYEIQHCRLSDGRRLTSVMKYLENLEDEYDEDGNVIPRLDAEGNQIQRTAEDDDLKMECSAEFIRILLLCSGRDVSMLEALDLMPYEGMDTIQEVFDAFEEKAEKLKKKKAASVRMRNMGISMR